MLHSIASNIESDVFAGYDMSSADATDQAVVVKIKKETKKIIFPRSAQKRRITTYKKKLMIPLKIVASLYIVFACTYYYYLRLADSY